MVNSYFYRKNCSVYEIYPQNETPHLNQIAHLDLNRDFLEDQYLLPGTVLWFICYANSIVFIVWDYRLNHSSSFSVDVDNAGLQRYERQLEVNFHCFQSAEISF
jgi:hypothetical protein